MSRRQTQTMVGFVVVTTILLIKLAILAAVFDWV